MGDDRNRQARCVQVPDALARNVLRPQCVCEFLLDEGRIDPRLIYFGERNVTVCIAAGTVGE